MRKNQKLVQEFKKRKYFEVVLSPQPGLTTKSAKIVEKETLQI